MNFYLAITFGDIGTIATLIFGVLSIYYVYYNVNKPRISVVNDTRINLYDKVVNNINGLTIKYNDKDIAGNMVLVRFIVINNGRSDIATDMVEKPIEVCSSDRFTWINCKIINKSPDLNAECSIENESVIVKHGLFRPNEAIYLECLAEGEIAEEESILINSRISKVDKVRFRKSIDPFKRIGFVLAAVALFFSVINWLKERPDDLVFYEIDAITEQVADSVATSEVLDENLDLNQYFKRMLSDYQSFLGFSRVTGDFFQENHVIQLTSDTAEIDADLLNYEVFMEMLRLDEKYSYFELYSIGSTEPLEVMPGFRTTFRVHSSYKIWYIVFLLFIFFISFIYVVGCVIQRLYIREAVQNLTAIKTVGASKNVDE